MTAVHEANAAIEEIPDLDFDAIVIGAGISGMYQLYRLRELGLRVRVLEAGTEVGGTWYWNRYPGARFDSESYSYGYSFSQELLDEWDWSEQFSGQPEIQRYCTIVADKFDLRQDIQFSARVASAHYDGDGQCWAIALLDGTRYRARFLITAIGLLSAPTMPRFEGIDDFQGPWCHTGLWPKAGIDFAGKRVAVIGTGASGVQAIQEIAKTAGHLTVFQRRPNWCTPLHNKPISKGRDGGDPRPAIRNCFGSAARPRPVSSTISTRRGTFGSDGGGAPRLLGGTLCRTGLWHLAGQFPRHADGPRGEPADVGFRRRKNPASA